MKLGFALTLALASLTGNPSPVRTQPRVQVSQNPPPPAPDTGTPEEPQKGSGTRPGDSKCPPVDTRLISLTPRVAETALESPNFWFYVPYAAKNVDHFSFVILDEQDNYVQNTKNVPLSGTPGFISLKSPPLEIGKRYRWYFSIYCDPNPKNQEDRTSVEGVIQRIAPTPTTATPQERIAQYLESKKPYSALMLLDELRRTNADDAALKADWEKLLKSFDLSNLTNQPIVPCCTLD
ncbi:MAG: DUF928 domain-containing protein [Oscillatoria princeps RMCB-10]|nr:DUF928 domain-containing protein [Oscillatoria princeps RMCB-10]